MFTECLIQKALTFFKQYFSK